MSMRHTLLQQAVIFTYDEASHGDDEEVKKQIEKQFNSVLNDLRPRPLYSLPTQPGICIPYGFIADDGTASRDIGVTMRLIDHPEVEIFFRDTSGTLNDYEPKKEIEYFWTIMYQQFTKLTEADFWGYRSIKMGGQAGKGMFVTIHRYDDSIDYGYIAVVSDNANLPSQMLYVIRTAARAKGEPVSKDDERHRRKNHGFSQTSCSSVILQQIGPVSRVLSGFISKTSSSSPPSGKKANWTHLNFQGQPNR